MVIRLDGICILRESKLYGQHHEKLNSNTLTAVPHMMQWSLIVIIFSFSKPRCKYLHIIHVPMIVHNQRAYTFSGNYDSINQTNKLLHTPHLLQKKRHKLNLVDRKFNHSPRRLKSGILSTALYQDHGFEYRSMDGCWSFLCIISVWEDLKILVCEAIGTAATPGLLC
jgi:hypothetical protein